MSITTHVAQELKDKAASGDDTLTLSVTPAFIERLVKKLEVDEVTNLSVQFAPNEIHIHGDAKVQKKVFGLSLVNLSIPFTLTLEPVAASGRTLQFSIRHLSIQNAEFLNLDNFQWISSTLFNHPPIITYLNHVITIDLNAVEGVSTIQYGHIRSLEVTNERLVVSLGV